MDFSVHEEKIMEWLIYTLSKSNPRGIQEEEKHHEKSFQFQRSKEAVLVVIRDGFDKA